MLESEMMDLGMEYFKCQDQFSLIKQEVPFLSRCIDVVLLDKNGNVISIEFKVSKWRHAIEQAKNHKLGADKAYICLPERKITKVLEKAIHDAGLGLLFFNLDSKDVVHEVIPAPSYGENIPAFREMLINNFSKICVW